jgi:hypothetical protein
VKRRKRKKASELTKFDAFVRRCKNNKWIALILVLVAILVGIAQSTDALSRIRAFFFPGSSSTPSNQKMVNSPGGMQAGRDININSNLGSENHGILTPGNDPDPGPMATDVPTNAVKVFLGSIRSYSTAMNTNHIVLAVRTNRLVWFRRTRNGLYFSEDIFRGDGRNVAKIRDNQWEVNPNNYFELTKDRHEIVVTDREGVALRCRYLNENAVQIEGRFKLPDFPPVVITTNQVFVGGKLQIPKIVGVDNYIDVELQ